MGCDVHMFAEKIDGRNGKWKKVGDVFPYPYYRKGEPNEYREYDNEDGTKDGWWTNPKKCDSPYKHRNYDLFAMLANVRNGYGFAGCDTGNGFIPIDMPRGLPEDVSPEIKAESDSWDVDGHSHSHFTIQELLDYDWDMVAVHRGIVSMADYLIYIGNGQPYSWCGGVSGPNIEHILEVEMESLVKEKLGENYQPIIDNIASRKGDWDALREYEMLLCTKYNINAELGQKTDEEKSYYTQVQWVTPYRESATEFIEETIPRLQKLGDPDKVRIVFWFDN